MNRRRFISSSLLGAAAAVSVRGAVGDSAKGGLRLATFRFDVTPPLGHPLCGGWIMPATAIVDPLEAIGFVLLGAGDPIVVCAVDWTGLCNAAHVQWRGALAGAAGTSPDRVAVQCVHQHDAPFVCLRADALVESVGAGYDVIQGEFFRSCLERAGASLRAALPQARPLTHIGRGETEVERVASNRRVAFGSDGRLGPMRASSCRDPELIKLPVGLIDPRLRTVAFYSGKEKIAACHYYATHPMSHYGKGQVSSDFVGLARRRRQAEEPGCAHLYFTGAAGNIAAGKYNDGSPESRIALTERMHRAIVESERSLRPVPLSRVSWTTAPITPAPDPATTLENQRVILTDSAVKQVYRTIASMRMSYRERHASGPAILLSALHLDDVTLLHLPAESFLEYQLRAQAMQPSRFICTAAYGDGGPWYIPTREAFPQGGYEVGVAFCSPDVDDTLTAGIKAVLKKGEV